MPEFNWGIAALVCAISIVADFVWAAYIKHVTDKSAWSAAILCAIIVGLGAITTRSWIQDPRMTPSAMLGAAIGTFIFVKMSKE